MAARSELLGLSDESIAFLAGVSNPIYVARIKSALIYFFDDFAELYTDGSLAEVWESFFELLDLGDIVAATRTILSTLDRQNYLDLMEEINTEYAKFNFISVTQVFDSADRYCGAWLTCYREDIAMWFVVDDSWNYTAYTSIADTVKAFDGLAKGEVWSYTVFGCIGNWPLIYSAKKV